MNLLKCFFEGAAAVAIFTAAVIALGCIGGFLSFYVMALCGWIGEILSPHKNIKRIFCWGIFAVSIVVACSAIGVAVCDGGGLKNVLIEVLRAIRN